MSAAQINQDLSTALSAFTCVSPGAQPPSLLASAALPPALLRSTQSGNGLGGGVSSDWCLFVCNLAPETEEATLWRLFGPFGAVRSITVAREHGTASKCKGYGFVNMINYGEALHAVQHLNG